MPNRSGSTPAVAKPTKRPSGVSPSARARSPLITTTADAPSLVCDELPAVTVPFTWNAGLSFASASSDVSRRGPSSASTDVAVCGRRGSARPQVAHDSVGEAAGVDCGHRALVAAQRERVLLLARDARLAGVVLGDEPRRQIDVRIVVSTSAGFGATLLPPIGTRLIDSVPPATMTSRRRP